MSDLGGPGGLARGFRQTFFPLQQQRIQRERTAVTQQALQQRADQNAQLLQMRQQELSDRNAARRQGVVLQQLQQLDTAYQGALGSAQQAVSQGNTQQAEAYGNVARNLLAQRNRMASNLQGLYGMQVGQSDDIVDAVLGGMGPEDLARQSARTQAVGEAALRQERGNLGLPVANFTAQSPVGKMIADAQSITQTFGADSPQARAIEAAIDDETNPAPDFGDANSLFRGFSSASADYLGSADAFQRVLTAAEDESAAGDVGLIFNFMRTLDPRSTVREGEFATAQNAGGIDARIRSIYNRAIDGQRLTPEQRADFVSTAAGQFLALSEQQEQRRQNFTGLAERFNIDPRVAVPQLVASPILDRARSLTTQTQSAAAAAAEGTRPTQQSSPFTAAEQGVLNTLREEGESALTAEEAAILSPAARREARRILAEQDAAVSAAERDTGLEPVMP